MLRFWKKKQKIIIGIHGIGNKPAMRLLRIWWKKAISEGLERLGHPVKNFDFEMVYWANFLYSDPLRLKVKSRDNPLYISDPYMPALSNDIPRPPSRLRQLMLQAAEKILDKIFLTEHKFFNVDWIADFIIHTKFKDLDLYYHQANVDPTRPGFHARAMIRQELARALKKHRDKDILLIAHSMGSIIAYDVLTQVVPDIKIHTFLTLGSPLGLPAIIKKILTEQRIDFRKEKRAPSPENIQHAWINVSDLSDRITISYDLNDDFKPNSRNIAPVDILVENDYVFRNERNHHVSYGYLRTPAAAEVIHEFLIEEKSIQTGVFKRKLQKLAGTLWEE